MTPGDASQEGRILLINHPIGGQRMAMHTFDLASGGIAFTDSGWNGLAGAGHPFHLIEGLVTWFKYNGADHWRIESQDGEIYLEDSLDDGDQEGTRSEALAAIIAAFPERFAG